MQIPVNKNIDDYKDDVFKGLTLRQAAMAALTVASGILGFAIGHFLLGLPQKQVFTARSPWRSLWRRPDLAV